MRRFLFNLITLIIIPLSLIVIILWMTIFSINNLKIINTVISKSEISSKIILVLPNYLTQNDNSPIIFNDSEKNRIIQAAVTSEDLQTNIKKITGTFISWFNSKDSTFSMTIDLMSLKNNARDEITAIYKEKYAALPECTSGELLLYKIQDEHQFPTCRIPSESKYDSIYKSFDPTIVTTDSINSFPDKIELPMSSNLKTIPQIFKQFRLFLTIVSLIDLILLSICLYMVWPLPKKTIRYLGIVMVVLSILIFAFKYFMLELISNSLSDSIINSIKNRDLSSVILPLYQSLAINLKNNFYLASLVLSGLGVLLLVINPFFKPKKAAGHEIISLDDEEIIASPTKPKVTPNPLTNQTPSRKPLRRL